MDYQFYQQPQRINRRSAKMETAALILGIIAVATICMVYPTLICGSLGIVFALLSRGGETLLTPKAKTGLILGCVGLCVILAMLVYTVVFANLYYGGLENMMREMYNTMGIDYDALLQSFS